MTSITAIINVAERVRVTRLDIWRESLAGVGRFEVNLDNEDNLYGGAFSPQNDVELKINGTSMLKGYVDDVLPSVSDPTAVYHNLIKVMGRDYGQDLVNLFLTKKYLEVGSGPSKVDDIIDDALSAAGAEITYTSSSSLPAKTYEFKRTHLLDGFCELAKLVDADFYVDDDKALQLFLLSAAPSSGVTLKAVEGAVDNNILSLEQIGEKVGFDIKNYVHVEAGDVDDHWTEGNASDWTNDGVGSSVNDTETYLAGKASVRMTSLDTGGLNRLYLQFPKYNYNLLDFSVIGEVDCSILVRHNHTASAANIRVYARDDSDHEIAYQKSATLSANTWCKISFPMGRDVPITSGDNNWAYVTGSSGFTWKLTRLGVQFTQNAPMDFSYVWADSLHIGDTPATAIAENTPSQTAYRKRMIPITRNDIKSQLSLNALAASELAKRKDPTQKLKVTSTFQSNAKYAGQTVIVKAPSSGIGTAETGVTYRILGLHHVAEPRTDLLRGFDAITEFDLVKYETTGVDPLRLRLISNPTWTYAQRLETRLQALEKG